MSTYAYLGACNYKSGTDFVENSGYFEGMLDVCLNQFNEVKA